MILKISIGIAVFTASLFSAQVKAITEDGVEVFLLSDKTWRYVNESDAHLLQNLKVSDTKLVKSVEATFLAKSKNVLAGTYYNPKKWTIANGDLYGPSVDHIFIAKGKSGVIGMMSSEASPIPTLESLKDILVTIVQKRSNFFRLNSSEIRTVNGEKVLFMDYSANVKGIDFVYIGHYLLTDNGFVGLACYTFQKDIEEQRALMEDFINGISIVSADAKTTVVELPPPPVQVKPKKSK